MNKTARIVGRFYFHSDHLGSSSLITNKAGSFHEQLEYFPYGEMWVQEKVSSDSYSTPYKFTGKEQDAETGLYYYGARYYDPVVSYFTSVDPAYDGMNLYAYCSHNPVRYVDPTGMLKENPDGSVTFNKKSDTMGDAAKKADWGDNWQAAASAMGVRDRFNDDGSWKKGSNSLVGMTLRKRRKIVWYLYGFKKDDFFGDYTNYELGSLYWASNNIKKNQKTTNAYFFVNRYTTRKQMLQAISNPETTMIIFSGHGSKTRARISAENSWGLEPRDFKKITVSPNLRMVIFTNCYQGKKMQLNEWQKAFGPNVKILGWDRTSYSTETCIFNSYGLFYGNYGSLQEHINSVLGEE